MKNIFCLLVVVLAGCGSEEPPVSADGGSPATLNAQAAPVVEARPLEIIDIDAGGAEKLLKENPKIVVLDVRTPSEYEGGRIAGATNIDFRSREFKSQIAALDKEKTYLIHCASGGRSTQAKPVFEELGFRHIYHMDGGLNAWKKEGRSLQK